MAVNLGFLDRTYNPYAVCKWLTTAVLSLCMLVVVVVVVVIVVIVAVIVLVTVAAATFTNKRGKIDSGKYA
jgi:hypothetical protein